MAQETLFIVQSFRAGRGTRLLADPSVACKSEQTARRTAERLARRIKDLGYEVQIRKAA